MSKLENYYSTKNIPNKQDAIVKYNCFEYDYILNSKP